MKMFLTLQEGKLRDDFFPPSVMERLRAIGQVSANTHGRAMTERELAEALAASEAEACIALSWGGCPPFTRDVLDAAPRLKLLVTPGGSVAYFATEAVYERGIRVCSANNEMAKYVAEGTLAYMLTGLRDIVRRDADVRGGVWNNAPAGSLFGASLGLVGLGTVGRHLLELVRPFGVRIKLYDPYIDAASLPAGVAVELCSLEEALSGSDIVSIHASKTDETYHMIGRDQLALLRDGALLVNTARGALIDEEALIRELQTGRISAVLDVYETEPLPADSQLRSLDNALLLPHVAGMIPLERYMHAMVEEIERFRDGEVLRHSIPVEQFRRMTR